MASQTTNGKAFEWAVATAFQQISHYIIVNDKNTKKPEASFYALLISEQKSFMSSAKVAALHIYQKEHKFFSQKDGFIRFQSDASGQQGDVRDVIISNSKNEFGISCKNNHAALKHSRISDKLDFIKEWGLGKNGCSDEYWHEITSLFAPLRAIKANNPNFLWDKLPNKADLYWKILDAWEKELWRAYGSTANENALFCQRLITYLFGHHDFYKIMRQKSNSVTIQSCNFNKKLTKPHAQFPSVIRAIDKLNGGQYSKTVAMNNGFSINFRIHSASSKIEPSLKFDITAISLPINQFYQQTLGVS